MKWLNRIKNSLSELAGDEVEDRGEYYNEQETPIKLKDKQ